MFAQNIAENNISMLGASDTHQPGVAAVAKGTTLGCKPRLDLMRIRSPEYDIHCRRVNNT